jgi:hypothetical protein
LPKGEGDRKLEGDQAVVLAFPDFMNVLDVIVDRVELAVVVEDPVLVLLDVVVETVVVATEELELETLDVVVVVVELAGVELVESMVELVVVELLLSRLAILTIDVARAAFTLWIASTACFSDAHTPCRNRSGKYVWRISWRDSGEALARREVSDGPLIGASGSCWTIPSDSASFPLWHGLIFVHGRGLMVDARLRVTRRNVDNAMRSLRFDILLAGTPCSN